MNILNQPVVLFTTFWDIDALLKEKYFIHKKNDKVFYRVIISPTNPPMCEICSISLGIPKPSKIPNISATNLELKRLYHFCPTYDMLSDYKKDNNWEKYSEKYRMHLKQNKDKIIQWVNSLEKKVYILCCWENTKEGEERCHRKLAFDAISTSKTLKEKAIFMYRHGNSIKNDFVQPIPTSSIISGFLAPLVMTQNNENQNINLDDSINYVDEIDSSQYNKATFGVIEFYPTFSPELNAQTVASTVSSGLSLLTTLNLGVNHVNPIP